MSPQLSPRSTTLLANVQHKQGTVSGMAKLQVMVILGKLWRAIVNPPGKWVPQHPQTAGLAPLHGCPQAEFSLQASSSSSPCSSVIEPGRQTLAFSLLYCFFFFSLGSGSCLGMSRLDNIPPLPGRDCLGPRVSIVWNDDLELGHVDQRAGANWRAGTYHHWQHAHVNLAITGDPALVP